MKMPDENAKYFSKISYALFLLALLTNFSSVHGADEATIDELKRNIEAKNAQVEAINKEIKLLDKQIQTTTQESQTLKGAIGSLEASRNKLLKEIQATQGKVSTANLTIEQLGLEITNKERKIQASRLALGDAIRSVNRAESFSLAEALLANENVSALWNEIESLTRFQAGVRKNMKDVKSLKDQLSQKKSENELQKKNLLGLKGELEDKKKIVDINKSQKTKLLSDTQSKEAIFKKQLEEKRRLSEAFLQEINTYERQLKFIIDPGSFPSSGKGILFWPLENIFVTQNFGDTEFSRSTNAYNGKGHNGVDFRASLGTKVMSALNGTVEGVGNTDAVRGCYSYGKWVLVRHDNGLSTLYAHLSLIKVNPGQRVGTGEIIGYSGNTGYSTGPHLHLGVYATQGVKIIKYQSNTNCNGAIIPVADIRAYLNPLLYL
ncbi:MAG: peptidoglycan DD-metalloendopeptidase family protein [Patescibacteria group bacterium]